MYLNSHISLNLDAQILHIESSQSLTSDDYQFLVVQKGSLHIVTKSDGQTMILNEKDLLMLPPETDATCFSLRANTVINVRFEKLFMDRLIPEKQHIVCNSVLDKKADDEKLSDILIRICAAFFTIPDKALMISILYEFINMIEHSYLKQDHHTELPDKAERFQDRKKQILDYVDTHYQLPLSLNDLAEALFLSPQYLSKFIRKNMNLTFTALLNETRLNHVTRELQYTDESVTNIALECGFANVGGFNRIFRQTYGMSPSAYRTKYREEKPSIDLNINLLSPDDTLPKPQFQSFVIPCDTESQEPWQKPWLDTINIGSLSFALRHSFHENFHEYRKQIPVRYVRFFNIFDDELLSYDEENNEFNFSSLDTILDFFYYENVYPFIELSFKPEKGYVSIDNKELVKDIFAKEKPLSYYAMALEAVLKHCRNHFGHLYMSQWRFEIWNKYDEDLTPLESSYQYSIKYQTFHKIIKSHLPSCKVGGPGFNMSGRFEDFMMLISALEQYQLPMDFLSFSAYSYKLKSQYDLNDLSTLGILSTDPSHIRDNFLLYQEYLKKTGLYANLPLYITEFGSTVSVKNHITESMFQAAFLCKNMAELSPYCSCLSYSYFSDSAQPAQPEKSVYSFSGLVSENSIPKPSLHAYSLLGRLGKKLISKDDAYLVTQSSATQYQLLCYHYTHYSKSYCFNSWDHIAIENTYSIFQDEKEEHLHFSLKNIEKGRYKVTQFTLNRNYGSFLDKYLRILERSQISSDELMTTIRNLREDEVQYYKQTSLPRQDIYFLTCNESLEIDVILAPHEVVFFDFSYVL